MFLKKLIKRKPIEKISLTEIGFCLQIDKKTDKVEWEKISKITAYKIDLFTIDQIRFDIQHANQTVTATEYFQGWEDFLEKLYENLPEIDREWFQKVAHPTFETNETEIYSRK